MLSFFLLIFPFPLVTIFSSPLSSLYFLFPFHFYFLVSLASLFSFLSRLPLFFFPFSPFSSWSSLSLSYFSSLIHFFIFSSLSHFPSFSPFLLFTLKNKGASKGSSSNVIEKQIFGSTKTHSVKGFLKNSFLPFITTKNLL